MRKLNTYQKVQLFACVALMLAVIVAASKATNYALDTLVKHVAEQKVETEEPAPVDESGAVQWDVLLDSPELEENNDLDEMEWESFEEAGLSYDDIIFEDEPQLGDKPWDMKTPLAQQLSVIRYGSSISFHWYVPHLGSPCSGTFNCKAGQYLQIHASYTPMAYDAMMAYVTPDYKVHAFRFNYKGAVTKTIRCTQTGKYRVCFLNRAKKILRVDGYYRVSK